MALSTEDQRIIDALDSGLQGLTNRVLELEYQAGIRERPAPPAPVATPATPTPTANVDDDVKALLAQLLSKLG